MWSTRCRSGMRDCIKNFVLAKSRRSSGVVQANSLDQDLSYADILAGRPGAWLVKQIFRRVFKLDS